MTVDGEGEPEKDKEHIYLAAVRDSVDASELSLHDEIVAANAMLSEYGFRFFDLTECSPRQENTRQKCAAAVRTLLKDPPLLVSLLRQNRKLPAADSGEVFPASQREPDMRPAASPQKL